MEKRTGRPVEHHDRDRGTDAGVPRAESDEALARLGESLRGLRYGSVLAIVQDGLLVQIDRTEKTRLAR